jgi:serine/threonine-protein kinase RsbW
MKEGFKIVNNISVPSDFSSISTVESLIDKTCVDLDVNEDAYGNVLIAVTEAVNNAIQHGNQLDKSLSVSIFVGDSSNEFCVNVKDEGSGFDFTNLPDPTSPDNIEKENGRGIFLMRSLADEVEFDDLGSSVNIYFSK